MQKGFLKTGKPFFFAKSPIVPELCRFPKKCARIVSPGPVPRTFRILLGDRKHRPGRALAVCRSACSAGSSSESARFLARPASSVLTRCLPNRNLASSCWKPKRLIAAELFLFPREQPGTNRHDSPASPCKPTGTEVRFSSKVVSRVP